MTPYPIVHLRPKFLHPFDFGRPISSEPPPPLQMITNQLKESESKESKDDYYMLSSPSLRSALVFSINSLILSGFPLTSFHLAEDSLPAFSWLHTLVCAVVQKYHEMPFIYNYSHF